MTDQITKLESVVELYRQGQISEAEYEERKQRIIQEAGDSSGSGSWRKWVTILLVVLGLLTSLVIGWYVHRSGETSAPTTDTIDLDQEPTLLDMIQQGNLQACATEEAKMLVLRIVGGSDNIDEYLSNGGDVVRFTKIRAAGADKNVSQVRCEGAIEGRARIMWMGEQDFSIPVRYDLRPSLENEGQVIATAHVDADHQAFLQMLLAGYNRRMEKARNGKNEPEQPSSPESQAPEQQYEVEEQSTSEPMLGASEPQNEAEAAAAASDAAAAASNAAH